MLTDVLYPGAGLRISARMSLAPILPLPAADPDQISVFEDGRKVGRVREIKGQWIWDIDWFGVGRKLVSERRAAGTLEPHDVIFDTYWQWVARSGVEKFGTGHAPNREKAVADFEAAWAYVTQVCLKPFLLEEGNVPPRAFNRTIAAHRSSQTPQKQTGYSDLTPDGVLTLLPGDQFGV